MKQLRTEQDLYKHIFLHFEKYLNNNNQSYDDIKPQTHVISKRQYYYIKAFSLGKDVPKVGKNKMLKLLNMLNLKLSKTTVYKLSNIKHNK